MYIKWNGPSLNLAPKTLIDQATCLQTASALKMLYKSDLHMCTKEPSLLYSLQSCQVQMIKNLEVAGAFSQGAFRVNLTPKII